MPFSSVVTGVVAVAVGGGHQVDGLKANHARNSLVAHQHAAAGDHTRINAAHAIKAQQAFLRRKADDEADLVHVRAEHHMLFILVRAGAVGVQVAHHIAVHLRAFAAGEQALGLGADRLAGLMLITGGAAQGGEFT